MDVDEDEEEEDDFQTPPPRATYRSLIFQTVWLRYRKKTSTRAAPTRNLRQSQLNFAPTAARGRKW